MNYLYEKRLTFQRKLLVTSEAFINDKISQYEYLKYLDLNEEDKKIARPATFEEMDEVTRIHEKAHYDMWKKHGINPFIGYIQSTNTYFVTSLDFAEVHKDTKKQKILEILKETIIAGYLTGDKIGAGSDLVIYEVLSGNINSKTTVEEAAELIFAKYGLPKDYLLIALA